MQYRDDKRSGNRLSALGLGCMRFPGGMMKIDKAKTEELLLKAYGGGVNYFDTAYIYPGSEETVGEIFEKNNLREKVYIATKLPQSMCKTSQDFDRFFDIQKKRLRTGYIDYYHMHNVTELSQWERLLKLGIEDWIKNKKASGEIRQIGFSFHGTYDEFTKLIDAYDWDFVLIQYNYININYQAGLKGLRYASEKGLPVFIMEPLLGGRLARLPKNAQAVLQKEQPGVTAASLGLRWVWNHPEVTLLLSGMSDNAQLEENMRISDTALPDALTDGEHKTVQQIKDAFNKSYRVPCTACGYCIPCPKKINIPACFEAYNNSFAISRYAGMKQYIMSIGSVNETAHFASDCVKCGKCEKQCPQNIQIQKKLKSVRRRFHFPGMKFALRVVRKKMSK